MKTTKSLKLNILLTIILLSLTSCTPKSENTRDKPIAYTTFTVITDFAKKIAGDKYEIIQLTPAGQEPHDYEPTAKTVASVDKAALVIYNGMDMEGYIPKLMETAKTPKYCEASAGITPLEGAPDPHVWLNPENAKIQFTNITESLSSADPENRAYYEQNLAAELEKLTTLHEQYKQSLTADTDRILIVSHAAFAYLCEAYGLTQYALTGIMSDTEPTPQKLAEIIDLIKEKEIKYIYYSEQTPSKSIQTAANETGAELLHLNPYEAPTNDQDYYSIMTQNLTNLTNQ